MVTVSGVESIKYSLYPEQTFSNSEPGCYNGDNLSYGVHNSTGCKGGDTTLKTFVSLPHFLRADPEYVNQFTPGMISNNETEDIKQGTYFKLILKSHRIVLTFQCFVLL